jgi:hypothetical protein
MNAPIDGLENRELFDFIVTELAAEFPDCDPADIAVVVEERRQRMSRPATGGALFLEVQKFLQLQHEELCGRR